MKTVWIYVDTSKDARDADHLKVFENMYIADRWLEANEPEGVAFEYPVIRSVHLCRRHRPETKMPGQFPSRANHSWGVDGANRGPFTRLPLRAAGGR